MERGCWLNIRLDYLLASDAGGVPFFDLIWKEDAGLELRSVTFGVRRPGGGSFLI